MDDARFPPRRCWDAPARGYHHPPAAAPAGLLPASRAQLERAHLPSRFLAMDRARSQAPRSPRESAASESESPAEGPMSPRRPISSRPNPFNVPFATPPPPSPPHLYPSPSPAPSPFPSPSALPSLPSSLPVSSPLLSPGGAHKQSVPEGDDVTVHFDNRQAVTPHPTAPSESPRLVAAPNYMIQSNDVNLRIKEDDEPDTGRLTPRHSQAHRRLLSIKPIRWTLYAVLCYLAISTLLAPFLPRRQPPVVKVYPATRMQPETVTAELPIYDSIKSTCLRQTFFLRNSTFLNLPLDMLEAADWDIENMCLPAQHIGAMWSRERGLTMDRTEYGTYLVAKWEGRPIGDDLDWYYEKTGKQKLLIDDDGIDLIELCRNASKLISDAKDMHVTSNVELVLGVGPAGLMRLTLWTQDLFLRTRENQQNATTAEHSGTSYTMTKPPSPDPSPVRTLAFFQERYDKDEGLAGLVREYMVGVLKLRPMLQNATQTIDQILDISRHLTKDVTDERPLREKLFGPDPQTEALRATKASVAVLYEIRHNLTTLLSAVESIINEQEDILREEDRLSAWVRQLIEAGYLSSGAGPNDYVDKVHLPNDTDSFFLGGKYHTNAWAMYRPRSEMDELGLWCVYPGCPPAKGETILVRLYMLNPTDALKGLRDDINAISNETDALEKHYKIRSKEYDKQSEIWSKKWQERWDKKRRERRGKKYGW